MPEQPPSLPWHDLRLEFERIMDLAPDQRERRLQELRDSNTELYRRLTSMMDALADEPSSPPPAALEALSRELSVDAAAEPGTRLGRYAILRRLGAGGMGTVYEAREDGLDRSVALKVIHPAMLTDAGLSRFEREAHLLAQLRHPAIAQVYEFGTFTTALTPGQTVPYFAMELVPDAVPITEYARTHQLEPLAAVRLVQEVLEAIGHAHQRGIVHRDLKPANILIDGGGRPKVIDFGIARSRQSTLGAMTSLATPGTLRYMSPEQCAAERTAEADVRCDIYAIGVVLYEVLEGRSPYAETQSGLAQLIDQIRFGRIRTPELACITDRLTQRQVRAVLTKALACDPDERYTSAAAFAADLEHVLHHEPVDARERSTAHELRLFARRNRGLVIAATLIGASLALGAIVSGIGLIHARHAQQRAEQESLRTRRVASFLRQMVRAGNPIQQSEGEGALARWLRQGNEWSIPRASTESGRLVEVVVAAASRLADEFRDDPQTRAALAFDLACVLSDTFRRDAAARLAREAYDIRLNEFGPTHDDTLRALVLTARLSDNSDPDRVPRLRLLVDRLRDRFGPSSDEYFEARTSLLSAVLDSHLTVSGLPDLDAAIDEAVRTFGADSKQAAWIRAMRALHRVDRINTLREPDPVSAIVSQAQDAVLAFEQLAGPTSLTGAGLRFALGTTLAQLSDDRAEPSLILAAERALAIQGPASALAYEARTELARFYIARRRLFDAEGILRTQVRGTRQNFGDDAGATCKAKAMLARILTWQEKDLDEAESLAHAAARDIVLTEPHGDSGDWACYFSAIQATALRLQGKLDQAETLLNQIVQRRARPGVPSSPWAEAYICMEQADTHRALNRPDQARASLAAALVQLRGMNDPQSPLWTTFRECQERLDHAPTP